MVETVCDDLIENVNNQIDLHSKVKENPEKDNIPVKSEYFL